MLSLPAASFSFSRAQRAHSRRARSKHPCRLRGQQREARLAPAARSRRLCGLHERDRVALQQDAACTRTSGPRARDGGRTRDVPTAFRVFFLTYTSSASSNTRFMYSSKPCGERGELGARSSRRERTMIRPSIRRSVFSYSQITMRCLLCRKRKMRFCGGRSQDVARARARRLTMGWVMIRCTFVDSGAGAAVMVAGLLWELSVVKEEEEEA